MYIVMILVEVKICMSLQLTKILVNFIKHKASTLWNQLPEVLKDHLSVRNFTRRLKVFLQSTNIS